MLYVACVYMGKSATTCLINGNLSLNSLVLSVSDPRAVCLCVCHTVTRARTLCPRCRVCALVLPRSFAHKRCVLIDIYIHTLLLVCLNT